MRSKRLRLLAATLLAGACEATGGDAQVVADLHQLQEQVKAISLGLATVPLDDSEAADAADAGGGEDFTERDRMALKVTLDFGRTLTPESYASAVAYALSSDGVTIRWLIARVCVERGHVDDAARLLVLDVSERPDQASYRIWKWWRFSFHRRPDFPALSLQFTDALLHQFETGSSAAKLAVARIFEKGEAEAKLSRAAFEKAIGYRNNHNKASK